MTTQYSFKYLDTDNLSKFLNNKFNNKFNLDIKSFNTSHYDKMSSYELHENLCKYWALDLYNFYKNNKDKLTIDNVVNEYFKNYYSNNIFLVDHIKYLISDGINIINYEQIEQYIENSIEDDEDEQFFLEMECNQDYECDSP